MENIGGRLKNLRVSLGLTQDKVAKKVGLSRLALVKIENNERKIKFDELDKLVELYDVTVDYLRTNKEPRLSQDKLDRNKFKTVLLYILERCGAKPNVGKTVLYKLLYFSDFNFYEKYNDYLTGMKYIKLPMGPAPYNFDNIISKYIENKILIQITEEYYGKFQYRLIPNRRADESKLSDGEKKIINDVIEKYSDYNASKISEISHRDEPWKLSNDFEEISYDLVKERNKRF